jgi:hypothetical protein
VKKFVVRVLLGLGVLFVALICLAAFAGWRSLRYVREHKPEMIALSERFTNCFYAGDRRCLETLTTWDDKTILGPASAGSQITARLGRRGKATPVEESWSTRTFTSVKSGTLTTTEVTFSVVYDADRKALEHFTLAESAARGLRVQSFRVNSPLLLTPVVAKTSAVP